ncbi:hypothetical protein HYV79_02200 [Candidatus Woesearchaeota archaeon]|nr:hypothetical protein [Candidatus Woesearchaeota archaeon]
MPSIEEHTVAVRELVDDINEKIRAGLLVKRQKLVGFAASEASTNLFALLLHKKDLISTGFNVNHKFFASMKRARENFPKPFENKEKILELLVNQELFRDKLCYGKAKNNSLVNDAVKNFFELKQMIETLLCEEI